MLNAVVAQCVPTTPNQLSSNAHIRPPTRCHQVRMLVSVRLMHMFIAILSHPGRRNHSSTAEREPVSLSHGKPFISELPTRLQELIHDVPRTIFAYLSESGALSSVWRYLCMPELVGPDLRDEHALVNDNSRWIILRVLLHPLNMPPRATCGSIHTYLH